MNAIDQLKSRLAPDHEDRQKLVRAIKNGNAGNMVIGEVLHRRASRNENLNALEAWLQTQGLELPAASTRSKYIRSYEAWVHNAGLDLDGEYHHEDFTDDAGQTIAMTLTGISTYKLYEARNMINRDDPAETLAWLYKTPINDIRDLASNKNAELEPEEGLRTIRVPTSIMEHLKNLEGSLFKGVNRQDIVSFLIMMVEDLYAQNPDVIRNMIDVYFQHDVPETETAEETAGEVTS